MEKKNSEFVDTGDSNSNLGITGNLSVQLRHRCFMGFDDHSFSVLHLGKHASISQQVYISNIKTPILIFKKFWQVKRGLF